MSWFHWLRRRKTTLQNSDESQNSTQLTQGHPSSFGSIGFGFGSQMAAARQAGLTIDQFGRALNGLLLDGLLSATVQGTSMSVITTNATNRPSETGLCPLCGLIYQRVEILYNADVYLFQHYVYELNDNGQDVIRERTTCTVSREDLLDQMPKQHIPFTRPAVPPQPVRQIKLPKTGAPT